MTYVRQVERITDIESAICNCGTPTPSSGGVNAVFGLAGTPPTNVSISNNQLTLSAGYHYYIEASILVRCSGFDGAVEWAVYDHGTNSNIGQSGYLNFASSLGNANRIGRRCCRALILNSGSDQTVDVRIINQSGSNYTFAVTSVGMSGHNFVGYPSLRIWELRA